MTNLNEAIHGAFAAHESVERGHARDPHRTVTAIRRRRMAYAAGTGSAAAVAIGAIAFGAAQLPGMRDAVPAASPSISCTDHPMALGNPKAFGSLDYAGRSYIDTAMGTYLFLYADGTSERLAPADDGGYYATIDGKDLLVWTPDFPETDGLVHADWALGSVGPYGTAYPSELNTWAWNVEVPDGAPAGVDTDALSAMILWSMGASGRGLGPGEIPEGATVAVIAHGPGGDFSFPVAPGETGPAASTLGEGVSSLEVLVTLQDGAAYSIHAYRDPNVHGPLLCLSPDPIATTAAPSQAPTPSGGPSTAPTTLSGPERLVFACGAALPPELEGALGFDVRWGSGTIQYESFVGAPDEAVALGAGGVVALGTAQPAIASIAPPHAEGWWRSHNASESVALFLDVVAVQDGVIVGVVPPDRVGVEGVVPADEAFFSWDGQPVRVGGTMPNVDARMKPCGGVEPSALEGATTVALLGTGPIGGPYEYAWTEVERP